MQNEVDQELAEAKRLEASGQLVGAAAAYEAILSRHPNMISAHLQLSALWQQLDRYRSARASVLAAADSVEATRRWEGLPFVTMRVLEFGEHSRVRELILGADWASPAVIRQSPTLSQHLWLSDAYEQAIALIDQVSAQVPANAALRYSRANALRYCGRMTEATEELEQCITLSPNFAFAHWTLAYHSQSEHPGSRIDRIRRAQADTVTNPVAQVHFNYALFKELDNVGDTAAAWKALAAGARLKRASVQYEADAEAAGMRALRKLAENVDANGAMATHGVDGAHTPLFIVGLPRTGTTVLERILSNHDAVSTAGELSTFTQSLNWTLDSFTSIPTRTQAVARLPSLDFALLGQRYLEATAANANGRPFVVDKNPSNVFHAWTIARAMPSARIICLVREPMDACFSNFKELFSGSAYGYSYDLAELARHHDEFSKTVACWQKCLPEQFLTVRYEDLVVDSDRVTADVLRFCGLAPRENLVDITRNQSPVLTASSAQVKEPIHGRNIGSWARYTEQLRPLQEMLQRP